MAKMTKKQKCALLVLVGYTMYKEKATGRYTNPAMAYWLRQPPPDDDMYLTLQSNGDVVMLDPDLIEDTGQLFETTMQVCPDVLIAHAVVRALGVCK